MPSRIAHLLFVCLLLIGQVGGWLHELSHHAVPVASVQMQSVSDLPEQGDNDGDRDDCLLCLSYAALSLALLAAIFAFLPSPRRFALPAGALLRALAGHGPAHLARGPPRFS